jgi:precorrin-6B methylase 2
MYNTGTQRHRYMMIYGMQTFSIQIWQVSRTDPEKFAQWTTFEPAKPAVAFLILV